MLLCKGGKSYKYVKVQYLEIYYEAYIENQYINLFEIFSILYYIIEDLENIFLQLMSHSAPVLTIKPVNILCKQ